MFTAHLTIFLLVFGVTYSIVSAVPALFKMYKERYETSTKQTTRELDKFFLTIKPRQVLAAAALIGAALGFTSGNWIAGGVVMIGGFFAPRIMLSIWKDMRSAKVEAQLMDTLLLIGNSLKSGLDIVAGIERVATTMKPPISEEFGLVLNAYRLGTPLESALADLTTRINSKTLETTIYAINIQRETGGNIIKTFDQLILTIREENKLQKKVNAITSQGRTQILFLAGFPWALGFIFFLAAPDFMAPALRTTWGQITLVFLIFWEIIGISVTRAIVRVDV